MNSNDQQREAELIQRYLEQSCSEAELKALEELLVRDPKAAEALADSVRLDAGLATIFRAERRTAEALAQMTQAQEAGRDEDSTGPGSARAPAPVRSAPVRSTRVRPGRRMAWRMAAAALLVAAAITLLNHFARDRAAPQQEIARTQKTSQEDRIPRSSQVQHPGDAESGQVVSGDVMVDGARRQALGDGSKIHVIGELPGMLRLADGSEIDLAPGSTAVLPTRKSGRRRSVVLHEGRGTFRVEQNRNDDEFQVVTQLGCVTALGTEFSVELQPSPFSGETAVKNKYSAMLVVAVLSGVVQVEFEGKNYVLGGGESRVFAQEAGRGTPGDKAHGAIAEISKNKISLRTRGEAVVYDLAPDVIVTIDGRPGKVEELSVGMVAALECKAGQGPVVSITVQGPTIGGEVKSIDAEKQTITIVSSRRGATGEQTLPIGTGAVVTVDGQPGKLSDLQPGMAVALRLTMDRKTVAAITRSKGKGARGADAPQAGAGRGSDNSVSGKVSSLDVSGKTITLVTGRGGGEHKLTVASDVKVTIDGKDAALADIKVDDRAVVKLGAEPGIAAEIAIRRTEARGR